MTTELVPAGEARAETEVLRSRFIASLAPALSVDAARHFIHRIQTEFPDASHHVPAFLIGHGASVTAHASDAGEPAGTAGRPVLAVLQGSGLGDVVIVVTRYFGGTKLGTGGLVRAYGDAVKAVLAVTPRAQKIPTTQIHLEVPYKLYERVRLTVEMLNGRVEEEKFSETVSLTIRFPDENVAVFSDHLRELSAGVLQVEVLSTGQYSILPITID